MSNEKTNYLNNERWALINKNLMQFINAAKVEYLMLNTDNPFDNDKFQKWLAEDYFQGSLSYWRHIRDGRKPFSDKFLRKIEKLHDLPIGYFENENKEELEIKKHFFRSMLFVRKYLKENAIEVEPKNELKLVKLIYSDSIENGKLSKNALKRYLDII